MPFCFRVQRRGQTVGDVALQHGAKRIAQRKGTQGEKNMEPGIDEVEMKSRVRERGGWKLFRRQGGEGERRIAPAVLEHAVDPIEEKENPVLLVQGKVHRSGTKGLDGDQVGAAEL